MSVGPTNSLQYSPYKMLSSTADIKSLASAGRPPIVSLQSSWEMQSVGIYARFFVSLNMSSCQDLCRFILSATTGEVGFKNGYRDDIRSLYHDALLSSINWSAGTTIFSVAVVG
jgi:hypothetical protein